MAQIERRRGYHPNHSMTDGLGGFMMDPDKTGAIAMEAARKVAALAAALVRREQAGGGDPDDIDNDTDRALADGFEVEQTVVVLNENPPNPRLAAIVVNQTRHAARWEFGSSPDHANAHRSLRIAGNAVGELRGEIG